LILPLIAQSVEHLPFKQRVVGSIPTERTRIFLAFIVFLSSIGTAQVKENMPKKILVVDDDRHSQVILTFKLVEIPNKVIILRAQTLAEAKAQFDDNPDLDLIAMDACVPDPTAKGYELHQPNTGPLVKYMRQTFQGPIVAVSSMFNDYLLKAGCNHDCDNKHLFPDLALALLKIPPP
jgi:CheY-like chemotaxis protein